MAPKRRILDALLLSQLALSLQILHDQLESWQDIDEDESWMGKQPPPETPNRGPEYAMQNIDKIQLRIGGINNLATALAKDYEAIKSEIEITNSVCAACFGYEIEQVVKFHIARKELAHASDLCKGAAGRAFEYCARDLRRLSARCENEFQRLYALTGPINKNDVERDFHIDAVTFFRNENNLRERLRLLILRIDESPSENSGTNSTPTAPPPPPFMNLIVDREKRIVSRKGHDASIDLSRRPALWEMFIAMFEAGERGCTAEEMKGSISGEWSAARVAKGDLKGELTALAVSMPDRRWRLIDDAS